jgi:hypothetical protein
MYALDDLLKRAICAAGVFQLAGPVPQLRRLVVYVLGID